MRKVLYLLAELDDGDLHWWMDAASVRHLRRGSELFAQGAPVAHLYLLVAGELEVRRNGRALARLWPGEVIGEISFLRGRPASAGIGVEQDALVLALPHDALRRKLGADERFSARFHRALCLTLADRLERADALGEVPAAPRSAARLDETAAFDRAELAGLSLAHARFEWLSQRVRGR
jgi:CRP/FNR family cyclic AMP-dependent transcriptional regulator